MTREFAYLNRYRRFLRRYDGTLTPKEALVVFWHALRAEWTVIKIESEIRKLHRITDKLDNHEIRVAFREQINQL